MVLTLYALDTPENTVRTKYSRRVLVFTSSRPSYHSVDGKQLVAPLQSALSVGHAPWNHPGDVDRRVLLLSPHDVEAQPFVRLGKLHDTWVGVALARRKRSYRRLEARREGQSETEAEDKMLNSGE